MKTILLAAVGLAVLGTSAAVAQPYPYPPDYYRPRPPVYVRPGPPPPVYVRPPPPVYVRPPRPRFTCYVSPRYGGGACVAPRYSRPGERCGCPGPYGMRSGRVG